MIEGAATTGSENPVPGQARLVWAAGAGLGEGATWDDRAGRLWWVDIRGRRLHRMDGAGGDRRSWDLHWGGGRVSRFAPDGRRLGRIGVPTERVTSCAFGGADLRTLFITSAGGSGSAGAGPAGGVFAAQTAAAGLPPGRIRLAEAPGAAR